MQFRCRETVVRSRRHRLLVAIYSAVGVALVAATWFAYGISNLEQLAASRPTVLLISVAIFSASLALAVVCRRLARVHEEPHAEYESSGEKPFLLLDLSS